MFKIGDKIVYPMYGAGVIEDVVDKDILGTIQQYYIMRMPVGSMTVMIPSANAESIGVRRIVDAEKATEILDSIKHIRADMTQNWSRRYRENMLKIKTGDLMEVADVIVGLMQREKERGLSSSERKMLMSAKQIFISEMILAAPIDKDDIECELEKALL